MHLCESEYTGYDSTRYQLKEIWRNWPCSETKC